MLTLRSAFLVLTLVILVVATAGCGGGDFRKTERYYLVANNTGIPYWQAARAGLVQAAIEVGVGAEMVGPENYDPAAQRQAMEELINVAQDKLPAGILVSPADPEMMAPVIDSAIAKGVNVITVDADAPKSKRLTFVGIDNYSVGSQLAEMTAKQLQNAGNVIVFTIAGQTNLEERLRGARDIFAQFPAVKIIDVVDIKGNGAVAFDLTKEILEKRRRSVDAFLCLEMIACPEVAEVLSRNNARDKIVIAMDTPVRTLEWIQHSLIQATVAQRPYTMTYVGLRLLADYHKYKPAAFEHERIVATLPAYVDTGATVVNKTNVDRFLSDQATFQPEQAAAAQ